jgi:hypothetical protein
MAICHHRGTIPTDTGRRALDEAAATSCVQKSSRETAPASTMMDTRIGKGGSRVMWKPRQLRARLRLTTLPCRHSRCPRLHLSARQPARSSPMVRNCMAPATHLARPPPVLKYLRAIPAPRTHHGTRHPHACLPSSIGRRYPSRPCRSAVRSRVRVVALQCALASLTRGSIDIA